MYRDGWCLEWKGKYRKTAKSDWRHRPCSCDVSLKVETQRALSLRFCRASPVGDSPTRDALVKRLSASPEQSPGNARQPRASPAVGRYRIVPIRTESPISRHLSYRRVPPRVAATASKTLRATGCNLVPAGVCGVLGDATPARNLLSQGPSHDDDDDDDGGVRNRETGTTGRQAGRQADGGRG